MHYSLVFTGRIREGATVAEARKNLGELFKISDPAVLDKVFSGKPVVLKKNLDENEARKQEMILYMAGAVCELRNNAPPPASPPAPEPSATAAAVAPPIPAVALAAPAAAMAMPAPGLPMAVSALALPGGLALAPSPSLAQAQEAIVPAALRGQARDAEMEQRAVEGAGTVRVTNHGRDGEALLDPMQAPWDPAFMPDGVKGLSWAGFMAPLLWGSFNGMRLSFLPVLGIRLFRHFVPPWSWGLFYLAFGGFYLLKGRQLAWENKQWRNGEHFNRVQRRWNIGALAFFLLAFWGLAHLTIAQRRAERLDQALSALGAADAAVAGAGNEQARADAVATRAKAREAVLANMDEPAMRESERRSFIEQDREEQQEQRDSAQPEAEPDAAAQPQS
jgi:hypothetical protein